MVHPIGPELRAADKIAKRGMLRHSGIALVHAVCEMAFTIQNTHRALSRSWKRAGAYFGLRVAAKTEDSGKQSLREMYATPATDLHQLEGAARFLRILTSDIFAGASEFLESHGYELKDFQRQVTNITNVSVGDMSGGSNLQLNTGGTNTQNHQQNGSGG